MPLWEGLNLTDLPSTLPFSVSPIHMHNPPFHPAWITITLVSSITFFLLLSIFLHVCVCVWWGCIITVLCAFNNAGGAAGTQLGILNQSINISQQSRCITRYVYVFVCLCAHLCGRLLLWLVLQRKRKLKHAPTHCKGHLKRSLLQAVVVSETL